MTPGKTRCQTFRSLRREAFAVLGLADAKTPQNGAKWLDFAPEEGRPTVSVAANRRKKPRRPEPDGVLIGGSTDRMGDDPDKKRKRCGKGSDGRPRSDCLAARAGPSGRAFAAIEGGKLAGWADWARDHFLCRYRRQFLPLDECRLVIGLSH